MTAGANGVVRVAAPAKINLYLHVTARREDGYHELDSLMAFADFGDVLEAEPGEGLRIRATGVFAAEMPEDEDNLAVRAARRLAEAAGVACDASLTLNKAIPVAAGLGGGASDAAATLKALCTLWGIADGAVDLPAIALELGADVPVCLSGRAAFVGGIGENIVPAPPLPDAGLLLVNPGVKLATQAVFEKRRGGFTPADPFDRTPATANDLARLLRDRENDLTESAIRMCPVIKDVLAALEKVPGCHLARMSGSGATCFGLFDTLEAAAAAASAVREKSWWVRPTRLALKPA